MLVGFFATVGKRPLDAQWSHECNEPISIATVHARAQALLNAQRWV